VTLRPYQVELDYSIRSAWAGGARNVLATAPTGAGKTVTFSHILADHSGIACAIAHRQELVGQISLALARVGLQHSIIAPRPLVRFIMQCQREETGSSFYSPNAPVTVAGVDTLIRRVDNLGHWSRQVSLWVMDEGHHLLRENKWGKAAAMFPNAYGLGVTATPGRADGKGLGRHADGLFDALVEGPGMRELIKAGYLTDYTILCPPSDLMLDDVPIGSTGDFSHAKLVKAVRRSHLVGDVVEHYLRHAGGKLGITFVPDVETANETAARFNAAGVPAAAISAKTEEKARHHLVQRYRRRELLQLVNVDIFGEGFDLPAIEVVSMARPTASFNLYTQQFGRGLRPLEGKERAIILDHVDNVRRHNGPPDKPRRWTLDRRPSTRRRTRDPDAIPVKICVNCTQPFEAFHSTCPYCSIPYVPARRDGPEYVDGDLVELDAEALAALRGEVDRIDEPAEAVRQRFLHAGAPYGVAASATKRHVERQEAQDALRRLIAIYGGIQRARGRSDREGWKRFFYRYGVDVLTAQTLGRPEAQELALRLVDDMGNI
jgi:superfamily II DNA or RNA helicase